MTWIGTQCDEMFLGSILAIAGNRNLPKTAKFGSTFCKKTTCTLKEIAQRLLIFAKSGHTAVRSNIKMNQTSKRSIKLEAEASMASMDE